MAAWLVVIWQFGESQILAVGAADHVLRWAVRKSVHLVVYGVLGGLLAVTLGPRGRWRWVIGLCLLVALADETHQQFVPNRAFTAPDVGFDMLGAVFGALVVGMGADRVARV